MRITGGFLKNQSLISPKGVQTRPTSEKVRQSLFNICQHHIEKAHFLDLFAGSGAMGIEALSRGASKAVFIEKSAEALEALRENINVLDLSPLSTIHQGDVLKILPKLKEPSFQLIYIDPPYEKGLGEKTLKLIDSLHLLHVGGFLFLEESSHQPLHLPKFTYLKLQKERKMGSSFLYQFTGI